MSEEKWINTSYIERFSEEDITKAKDDRQEEKKEDEDGRDELVEEEEKNEERECYSEKD